jgi:hypothetical protein
LYRCLFLVSFISYWLAIGLRGVLETPETLCRLEIFGDLALEVWICTIHITNCNWNFLKIYCKLSYYENSTKETQHRFLKTKNFSPCFSFWTRSLYRHNTYSSVLGVHSFLMLLDQPCTCLLAYSNLFSKGLNGSQQWENIHTSTINEKRKAWLPLEAQVFLLSFPHDKSSAMGMLWM